MGNSVCTCGRENIKDNVVFVEVPQPTIKSKSAMNLPRFNQTVLPQTKPIFDSADTKWSKEQTNISRPKSSFSCQTISSIVSKKRSKTSMRRSVFFNRTFINIVILGDKKTGKSSYLKRLYNEKYSDEYIQSNDDERKIKKITQNGRSYNVSVHIPINDKLFDIANPYDFYLIFFDSSSIESFYFAKELYENKLKEKNNQIKKSLSTVIFIANMIDRNEYRFKNECIEYCKLNNINCFEISVKDGTGISKLTNKIVEIFDCDTFHDKAKCIDQ